MLKGASVKVELNNNCSPDDMTKSIPLAKVEEAAVLLASLGSMSSPEATPSEYSLNTMDSGRNSASPKRDRNSHPSTEKRTSRKRTKTVKTATTIAVDAPEAAPLSPKENPESQDEDYILKRARNNEAVRRCRRKKKAVHEAREQQILHLQREVSMLQAENSLLRQQLMVQQQFISAAPKIVANQS